MKTISAVGKFFTIAFGIIALASLLQRGLAVGLADWQREVITLYRTFSDGIVQLIEWIPALLDLRLHLPNWAGDYLALHCLTAGAIFRTGDLRGTADFGDPLLWSIFPGDHAAGMRYASLGLLTVALPIIFAPYFVWFKIFVLRSFLAETPDQEAAWIREVEAGLVSGFVLVPIGTVLFFILGALPNVL